MEWPVPSVVRLPVRPSKAQRVQLVAAILPWSRPRCIQLSHQRPFFAIHLGRSCFCCSPRRNLNRYAHCDTLTVPPSPPLPLLLLLPPGVSTGSYEAAVEGFRQASRLQPKKHSHFTCLGKVYLRWGRHENEALTALEESLRLEHTDIAANLAAKAHMAIEKAKQVWTGARF